MSSQVVDKLVMELELELGKFRTQSQEAERLQDKLKKSLGETEGAGKKASNANDDLGESVEKSGKKADKSSASLLAMVGRLRGLFTTITTSVALERLATGVAKVNDQLGFMQKRLDMSARSITLMSNAAAMLGGDARGMQSAMKGLNQSIQQLVIMGDATILPFMNALGVGVTGAQGKVRSMDAIMLDMADSFSRMNTQEAYALASAMGLDDGVADALIQGRDAMQEMMDMQATMYVSTQSELNASRELRKNQTLLSAQWHGIKTMLGNALIPLFTRIAKGAQQFTDYLMRNERAVKRVFEGLAYAVGVLTVAAFGKAVLAAAALLAPFGLIIAAVATLATGFALLYEDYKTWAEGGTSLFDWETFDKYIRGATFSVENLGKGFVKLLTGYESLDEAVKGFANWLKFKGFVEDGEISVNSLAQGFKNLAKDIFDSIPVLRTFADVISKLLSGDFKGAFSAAASMPTAAIRTLGQLAGSGAEHLAGAVDTALGHDPSKSGTIASTARSVMSAARGLISGGGDDMQSVMRREEARHGLPAGTLEAIRQQETSGSDAYINDPAKYHYEKNKDGKRIAGHTGKISTAFGPFGILESTGRDPGYGVDPLKDKSLNEQIRFVAAYLAARSNRAGGLEAGLSGYGEGSAYSKQVMSRIDGTGTGRNYARSGSLSGGSGSGGGGGTQNDIQISVGGVTVHTSAATLSGVTNEAVSAGIDKGAYMLNQTASGL